MVLQLFCLPSLPDLYLWGLFCYLRHGGVQAHVFQAGRHLILKKPGIITSSRGR